MARIPAVALAVAAAILFFACFAAAQISPPPTVLPEDQVIRIVTADGQPARAGVPTLFNLSILDPWRSTADNPVPLQWMQLVDPRGDGIGKLPVFVVAQDLGTLFHVTADIDFPRYNWDSNQFESVWQIELLLPRVGNYGIYSRFEVLRTDNPRPPTITFPNRNDTSRHTGYGRITVLASSPNDPTMGPIANTSLVQTTRGLELNPLHPDSVTIGITPADLALPQPVTTPPSALSIDRFQLSLSIQYNTSRIPVLPTGSCAFFFANASLLESMEGAKPMTSFSPIYEAYSLFTVVHESMRWWDSKGSWVGSADRHLPGASQPLLLQIVGTNRAPGGLCPPLDPSQRFVETPPPSTMSQSAIISYGPTVGTPITFPLPGKYAIFFQAARVPFQEKRRTMLVGQWIVEVRDGVPRDAEVLAYLSRDNTAGGTIGPYPNTNNSAYDPSRPPGSGAPASAAPTCPPSGSGSQAGLIAAIAVLSIVAAGALVGLGVTLYKQRPRNDDQTSAKGGPVELSITKSAKVRGEDDGRPFVRMEDVEEAVKE
ncbi:hypothetical protein DFJ74DRAFT_756712 [Hyaloraphidium curvatum]|nr:hypothetical protein DFJ74DRAFT_756712 [Hyaloraphidium curvatum]